MKSSRNIQYILGFRNKSALQRAEICRRVIAAFDKAPAERLQYVKMNQLKSQLTEADDALTAVPALRAALQAGLRRRNEAVAKLCRMVTNDAKGYWVKVSGEAPALVDGGLELKKPWRPLPQAGTPKELRAERGAHPGTVVLRWKRPMRRCWFTVEYTTDPKAQKGWTEVIICIKAKHVITNLEPGRLYWFRVMAGNARGQSPWSQPVSMRPG